MEPMRDNMANMLSRGIILIDCSPFCFGFIGMAKLLRCTGEQAPGWGGRFKTLLFIGTKAKFFVLQKIPCEKYISSCYHVKDDVYEIEFKGKRTRIDLSMDWQKMVHDFINNRGV
jgi:hypothetical protein